MPLVWVVVIGFVVSGLGSYVILSPQREAFARRVDERARRATSKIEEMRAKEDADEPVCSALAAVELPVDPALGLAEHLGDQRDAHPPRDDAGRRSRPG